MDLAQATPELNSGSRWHRWEPHVHAPGTILNDQFKGASAWEAYLEALESATPTLRAIGVTDYYNTDSYERVCAAKKEGRLPQCALIFPNIEMRLGIGTVRGRWVNLHLLVSPEESEHVAELKRFLTRLTFRAHDDSFACTKDDLIRLGKKHDPRITNADIALERGSEQFKVSIDELKRTFKESIWAQRNILIAVAGSETDGTSGVRDAADATLRQEVEKFAHVIFASSVAQRDFWLGRGKISESDLRSRYDGLKPCMHGSDAHEVGKVGLPDGDRYSWIKDAPQYDSLRQACIDPAGRAFVGGYPPVNASSSQVISSVEFENAPWAVTQKLELNPGLVAIIGARGSGKTALADAIAMGCDAIVEPLSPASFLNRARDLLQGASVTLKWESDDVSQRMLGEPNEISSDSYPRARYLSQQFVEELCSAQGITDTLLKEIERVIFEAHPLADRDGAVDFGDLLQFRASRFRDSRAREEIGLAEISERIGTELEKQTLVEGLKKQVEEKGKLIAGYQKDLSKLVVKGNEAVVPRLNELNAAAEKVRGYLRFFKSQEQSLLGLQDEVANVRTHQAPEQLRQTQEKYKDCDFEPDDWPPFLMDYTGDVDGSVEQKLKKSRNDAKAWKGIPPPPATDPKLPLIKDDTNLDNLSLALLEAEIARLGKIVSAHQETVNKFSAISKRITEENSLLGRLRERLKDCEGAKERAKLLVKDRESAYARVFDAINAEQQVLTDLYSPLMQRLDNSGDTLKKLSFTVARTVDTAKWAKDGEHLLDLRQRGPFKGQGSLLQMAETALKPAWESGDSKAVSEAMARFRAENQASLIDIVPKTDLSSYRSWAKRFAKWLYSTEHITIQYSINYDSVDIRKLSPGTRGIVLLLLYLALDDADDRPLIIDQPEENLDPKSIFDELVSLFISAKEKRQVIIVTHNSNLVVNTDADQIIVAQAGPHAAGELPPITYLSGGLESGFIRKEVCDILEGGEHAFQERARRLRVRLDR